MLPTASPPRKTPLPLFALLESPYGMSAAIAGTLPLYVLHAQGVSLEKAAAISALCLTPTTFAFLYSPLVDFFMRRRSWYLLGLGVLTALTAAVILLADAAHLQVLTALMFALVLCSVMLGAATGGLANQLGKDGKKIVGAWMQLGNLAASSMMMALLVYASSRCSRTTLALLATGAMLLPGLAILAIDEPPHREPFTTFGDTAREVWVELKTIFLSWRAVPALLLLISPIGNNGIASVLMGLTKSYHATEAQLTFANGWGGGAATALGALSTLMTPKAWNRMLPYAIVGVIYGTVSLSIGVLPLTPAYFVTGLLLTNFVSGMAFGLYTGLVLQSAGFGGLRHSMRYTILNSVGNVPVVYMLALLGFVAGRKGIHAAGMADGLVNIGVAVVFFCWYAWAKARRPALLQVAHIPDEAVLAT